MSNSTQPGSPATTTASSPAADESAPAVGAVKDAAANAEQTAKETLDKASAAVDEWLVAARDAIRANPLAAIGGALLVGAAYVSLTSRKR
jgi:N-acetylglucosamine kinase-like BadF-type ATPase